VVAGAAANKIQIARVLHLVHHSLHIRAASQHVQHLARHLRLLVDLFQHEVSVAALLHGAHRFGDLFRCAFDQAAVLDRAQLHVVCPEGDDLAILDADDGAGEGQDRGQVGGDAGEALANAHYQARAFFDGVEFIVIDAPNDVGVVALQVIVGAADGFDEIQPAVDVAFHRVHTRFAVVLRAYHHALFHEHLAQFHVINDVAVMRADHIAIRIQMRLRIHLGGRTKGGPAQLGDTARAAHFG